MRVKCRSSALVVTIGRPWLNFLHAESVIWNCLQSLSTTEGLTFSHLATSVWFCLVSSLPMTLNHRQKMTGCHGYELAISDFWCHYYSKMYRLALKHRILYSSHMTHSRCSATNMHIAVLLSYSYLATYSYITRFCFFWRNYHYFCDFSLIYDN